MFERQTNSGETIKKMKTLTTSKNEIITGAFNVENNGVNYLFEYTIRIDEFNVCEYFELKRDGGIICSGRSTASASKFTSLMFKLGYDLSNIEFSTL